jgi:hypothetical protein
MVTGCKSIISTPIVIALIAMVFGLSGCPRSQPITVEFPADADWEFEYFDHRGEQLGFGRAKVTIGAGGGEFTMKITENAFGDRAVIRGLLIREDAENDRIRFNGEGSWFMGEPYRFHGQMPDDLSGMVSCGLAWPGEVDVEQVTIEPTCRANIPNGMPDEAAEEIFLWRVRSPGEPRNENP